MPSLFKIYCEQRSYADLKKHAAERETKFRKLKLQARAKIKALANTGFVYRESICVFVKMHITLQ